MRIRTMLAFGLGAAVGAGVTYLGDPDHGEDRRAEAGRWALARGREQAATAMTVAMQAGRTYALAAIEGFREGTVHTD